MKATSVLKFEFVNSTFGLINGVVASLRTNQPSPLGPALSLVQELLRLVLQKIERLHQNH